MIRWEEDRLSFCTRNSVQSIIDLVFGKCLNALGRFAGICSFDDHAIRNFNSAYKKCIQVVNILLMSVECTPNKSLITSTSKPRLSLTSVIINSSFMVSFLLGPTFLSCRKRKKKLDDSCCVFFKYTYLYGSYTGKYG